VGQKNVGINFGYSHCAGPNRPSDSDFISTLLPLYLLAAIIIFSFFIFSIYRYFKLRIKNKKVKDLKF